MHTDSLSSVIASSGRVLSLHKSLLHSTVPLRPPLPGSLAFYSALGGFVACWFDLLMWTFLSLGLKNIYSYVVISM